jgi:hypothetical protein
MRLNQQKIHRKENTTQRYRLYCYFSRTDSISFFNMTKTLRMRGDSRLSYKNFNLEAEIIQLNFNETSLNASGAVDSTGKPADTLSFPTKAILISAKRSHLISRPSKA